VWGLPQARIREYTNFYLRLCTSGASYCCGALSTNVTICVDQLRNLSSLDAAAARPTRCIMIRPWAEVVAAGVRARQEQQHWHRSDRPKLSDRGKIGAETASPLSHFSRADVVARRAKGGRGGRKRRQI
jgi:hypothetical protein